MKKATVPSNRLTIRFKKIAGVKVTSVFLGAREIEKTLDASIEILGTTTGNFIFEQYGYTCSFYVNDTIVFSEQIIFPRWGDIDTANKWLTKMKEVKNAVNAEMHKNESTEVFIDL